MEGEKKVRIGNIGAISVVVFAALFDFIQFLCTLLVATILLAPFGIVFSLMAAIVAYVGLFFIFKFAFKGVKVFGGKSGYIKILAAFGALVVELIPFIQALPGITMFALTIVIAVRIEDTLGDAKSLERLVGRRTRENARLDKKHTTSMDAAKKTDETKERGNKTQESQKKKNEKERRQYDRKVGRQNVGMVARAAFGVPRKDRLDRTRQRLEERRTAPGVLEEDLFEGKDPNDFDQRELERYDLQ